MATATTTATDSKKALLDKRVARKVKKAAGRVKMAKKLATDKEFATTYFAAKSKRAVDKKAAFKKRKKARNLPNH